MMSEQRETIIVDGTNHILGRLASEVAKLLLEGKKVVVVNSEKVLVSGNRRSNVREYLSRLEIKSRTNPIYGPYHPRRPENIVARTVRGMLPMRKSKGAVAFSRLRVYASVPSEYEKAAKTTYSKATATKPLSFYIRVGEISEVLGREVTE
ncbi:MAG: 50S ribosomal protein L13 [Nitrososphaeria archaeon]